MRRSSVILAILVGIAALLVAVDAAPDGNVHTGDTDIVVEGARVALDCVHLGTWTECGATSAERSDVGPYPVLQYLPAAVLAKLTDSDDTVVRGLARLNFVAFVAMVATVAWVTRRRVHHPAAGPLSTAIVVLSPLWYYATAGFGEMLSAVALVAVVLAVVERRPVLIALAMVAAGTSKETLPYVALALAVLVGTRPDDGWTPPRRVLVPAAAGAVGALGVNSLFNVFRYGRIDNPFYLQELFRVSDARRAAGHWVMIIFSPNAGVLAFWPVLLVPAGLAGAALVGAVRRGPWAQRLRWVGLVGWPLAFFATASLWFSPFGWIAWGPRLQVPVLAAWGIAVVLCTPAALLDRLVAALAPPARVAVASVVAAVLALVPAASPWSYAVAIGTLIEADATCPNLTEIAIERDAEQYFRCLDHLGWRRPGAVLLRSADPNGSAAVAAQVVLAAAAVLLVLELAAPRLAAGPEPPREEESVEDPQVASPG